MPGAPHVPKCWVSLVLQVLLGSCLLSLFPSNSFLIDQTSASALTRPVRTRHRSTASCRATATMAFLRAAPVASAPLARGLPPFDHRFVIGLEPRPVARPSRPAPLSASGYRVWSHNSAAWSCRCCTRRDITRCSCLLGDDC